MTRDDDWTTTYRCHATSYVRGDSVAAILAEQFGFDNGVVKGKGGSMHPYNKASNFWGGRASSARDSSPSASPSPTSTRRTTAPTG